MVVAKSPVQARKDRALHVVREGIRRDDVGIVKNGILQALKANCSDSQLGEAVRLAVMEDAVLPRKEPQ